MLECFDHARLDPPDKDTIVAHRIHGLADDMCRCADLTCARNLQAQYTRFIRFSSPTDDKARESAERDGTRLADCEARFER